MALRDNPLEWSYAAVGTWPRFYLFAAFQVLLVSMVVYFAAFERWQTAIGPSLIVIINQLYVAYALRRLVIASKGVATRAP